MPPAKSWGPEGPKTSSCNHEIDPIFKIAQKIFHQHPLANNKLSDILGYARTDKGTISIVPDFIPELL